MTAHAYGVMMLPFTVSICAFHTHDSAAFTQVLHVRAAAQTGDGVGLTGHAPPGHVYCTSRERGPPATSSSTGGCPSPRLRRTVQVEVKMGTQAPTLRLLMSAPNCCHAHGLPSMLMQEEQPSAEVVLQANVDDGVEDGVNDELAVEEGVHEELAVEAGVPETEELNVCAGLPDTDELAVSAGLPDTDELTV